MPKDELLFAGKKFIKVTPAAARLGMSSRTLTRHIKKGTRVYGMDIQHIKHPFSGHILISLDFIEEVERKARYAITESGSKG